MTRFGYKRLLLVLTCLCAGPAALFAQSQTNSGHLNKNASGFIQSRDIFGTRVFVENRGQFKNKLPHGETILYAYEHLGELVYFTPNGLIRVFSDKQKEKDLEEEEREAKEKGQAYPEKDIRHYYVYTTWKNAMPALKAEGRAEQPHYMTYGEKSYNARTFKKILYKNVYPNIDIEFSLPADKESGMKYDLILQPGAHPEDVQIAYSGDVKDIQETEQGDILIKTPTDVITEHAPVSFYENQEPVASKFRLRKGLIAFEFPQGIQPDRILVVDPWITVINSLATSNVGYDVDYDATGNTFIYGGTTPFKMAKYNIGGALVWTFSGTLVTPSWSATGWPVGILVEKSSGKTYFGKMSTSQKVIRLDASGNYDNFISGPANLMSEVGELDFTCNGDIILFGGAFASADLINVPSGNVTLSTNFHPTISGCCHDVVCEARDGFGNFFVLLGSGGPMNVLANKLVALTPSYTNNIWTQPTTFSSFTEVSGRSSLPVGATGCSWFKCLAVNNFYLYYYDGYNLAAYNKSNGNLITAVTVSGLTLKQQGGIDVDDCNNLYLGGNSSILCYNFNGTTFSTLTAIPLNGNMASQYVYDLKLNKSNSTLHVTGSGFVGNYAAPYSTTCAVVTNSCACIQPYLAVNTQSTNCGNIGSSTVNVGGMPGPFTYTWMPGGQTSSVITGLNPGTYTISVTSTSCNVTTSTTTTFTSSLPPYQLNVATTSITCANLGSATVNLTGMPGPFSYTWTPSAQTGSAATGLSPGTYTLTIFSASCNATFTTSTTFIPLVPLTGTVLHASSVSCNAASTATGAVINLSGGSGSQYYSWSNGAQTLTTSPVYSLSSGLWTLTVTDALTGCTISDIFFISQPLPLNPVIVASSPTTCAGTGITFTASNSGGTPGAGTAYTYTWTGGPLSDTWTAVQNLAGNYIYTVLSADANSCTSSQTVSVDYVPNPTLSVSNASICPLETGTLYAGGATSYTWLPAASNGSSFSQSPAVSTQYTLLGTALSCTSSATASIILKPLPTPVFNSNSPKCQNSTLVFGATGGTAFLWSGVNSYTSALQNNTLSASHPTQSGVYQVTVTAANSCTASVSGSITINPTPTISASGGTVCVNQTLSLSANSFPGSAYVWTGPNGFVALVQNPSLLNPVVAASGNYTVKATSIPGCTISTVVNASVTPMPLVSFTSNSPRCYGQTLGFNASSTSGALTYSWSGPNSFSSQLQNPQIPNASVAASGLYTLLVTAGPCTASTAHSATVHPLPQPVAYNTGPVCEGKNVQLGVNNCGISYAWYGPAAFSSSLMTQVISSSSLSQSGTYTVIVTDANTCQNSSTSNLSILPNPTLSTSNDLVCFGEAAQIGATGADTYYWMGPGGFSSNIANPLIDPAINTQVWTYTVIGTALNGCTAVATSTVGTRVLPVPVITVTPRMCVNSEIHLQAQGGIQYVWTGPQNFYSSLQNPVFIASNIGMSGTYSLMVSDAFSCKGYTTGVVQVDAAPGVALGGDLLGGCAPFCSNYSLQASSVSTLMNVVWQLDQYTSSGPVFSYCFSKAGVYELKVNYENERNCKGLTSFVIPVYAKPLADFEFSPIRPIENEGPVLFTNTSSGDYQVKWSWTFMTDKVFTVNSKNAAYTFDEAGLYPVALLVENKYSCKDTILKTVEILPDFHVYVPNAFSPNNDGLNDVFFPVMRGVKKYTLQIFDRWGALLFESRDASLNWDGTYKGQACEQAAYTWILNLLTVQGEEEHRSGSVLLYR
ncbi:MAG TPA: gliding motility-associated C-terminal domain-containing protein [Bacteroidia bacterium]|nr:gliding motility-associated C-terminal domain-containing protein [Bacteroidia bacterium]